MVTVQMACAKMRLSLHFHRRRVLAPRLRVSQAIEEALEADEVFTTGTAVVVASVGSITYKGRRVQFGNEGEPGKLAKDMYDTLVRALVTRAGLAWE